MKKIIITANEANQRLDRFLRKYLKNRKINKPKNKRMDGFTRRKKHPFGISQEKIVDVDYDEVKK